MKCPLRQYQCKGAYDQDLYEDLDCLKSECGWFDETSQKCSIAELPNLITCIWHQLGSLTKELTLLRQRGGS